MCIFSAIWLALRLPRESIAALHGSRRVNTHDRFSSMNTALTANMLIWRTLSDMTDKPLKTIFPRNGGRVEARIDAGANEKAVVVPPHAPRVQEMNCGKEKNKGPFTLISSPKTKTHLLLRRSEYRVFFLSKTISFFLSFPIAIDRRRRSGRNCRSFFFYRSRPRLKR
ncbi:hypothetical protein EI94DRAFT_1031007 [Lactarius quietus]|nr:hypothetical protein EI94DRAFT_1031007 [Lactarius quietus]